MVDAFDRAAELEWQERDFVIKHRHKPKRLERPDEEHGIRYCLGCGKSIPVKRLQARPDAVRCTPCQTKEELQWNG